MYNFTLQMVFMGSLATIAFMFARALPRVEEEESSPSLFDYIESAAKRLPLHKLDDRVHSFAFKALKRMRVVTMRIDNRIIGYLERMKRWGDEQQAPAPAQSLLDSVQNEKKE